LIIPLVKRGRGVLDGFRPNHDLVQRSQNSDTGILPVPFLRYPAGKMPVSHCRKQKHHRGARAPILRTTVAPLVICFHLCRSGERSILVQQFMQNHLKEIIYGLADRGIDFI
jgi:hypothetical protein